jgi:hypothetical protein
MANVEFILGGLNTKRFPTGSATLTVAVEDVEWIEQCKDKLTISGWGYPIFDHNNDSVSLVRSILARHGFTKIEEDRIERLCSDDPLNVCHDNIVIPESLVPEFPLKNNYNLTLGAHKRGLQEAADRLDEDYALVNCIEEGTRQNHMFVVDKEDVNFFQGTKVKFGNNGCALFFCEDMKFRTAAQELVRRNRLGVSFGAPDAIVRRVTNNRYDIRKGQVAVFRTVRKPGC